MSEAAVHVPVLLNEVLAWLAPQPGQRMIDATVDGGGHASALLEHLGPSGAILGIDRDPGLAAALQERLGEALGSRRLLLETGSFRGLGEVASAHGFTAVHGILFDLGLSSYHFDLSGRGFSFMREEPLDMRFDPTDASLETATDIVASRSAGELTALFRDFGEERFASRIARNIVAARERAPVTSTTQLVELIRQVLPGKERGHAGRSAARVFQALRIAVNDELAALAAALPQAVDLLAPGGRLAVIAFHSLEDRIVKHYLLDQKRAGRVAVLTKRPIRPTDAEIRANPRSASAKVRVAERTG